MSGFRRTSFTVASPTDFASNAIPYIGRQIHAQPLLSHRFLWIGESLAPTTLLLRFHKNKMIRVKSILERRKLGSSPEAAATTSAPSEHAPLSASFTKSDEEENPSDTHPLITPPRHAGN
jgi:hypothetical protein